MDTPTGPEVARGGPRGPEGARETAPVSVTVRPLLPADAEAMLAIVFDAFGAPGATAARNSRSSAAPGALPAAEPDQLVAVADGAVAGHVLAAPGRVDGRDSAIAGVAPVCVAPAHQNGGTGSALVRELIRVRRGSGLAPPRAPR